MKLKFSIVISGEPSIEQKLNEAISTNPEISSELLNGVGHIIMLAMKFKRADKLAVESFTIQKVDESTEKDPKCENINATTPTLQEQPQIA